MRATVAEEASQQRIALQTTKMENPFAAEHPADDEIEQDTVNGKKRVARFATGEAAHRVSHLDFFKKSQKDFDASEAGRVLQ